MTTPTDPVSMTLEAQQWNVILASLGETPWRIADPVIKAIMAQRPQSDVDQPDAPRPNGAHPPGGMPLNVDG